MNAFNHSIQEAEAGGSLLSSKHNEFPKKNPPKTKTVSKERQKNKTNPKKI